MKVIDLYIKSSDRFYGASPAWHVLAEGQSAASIVSRGSCVRTGCVPAHAVLCRRRTLISDHGELLSLR